MTAPAARSDAQGSSAEASTPLDRARERGWFTETYWRHVGLAALAGALATLAAFRSPILGTLPPIVPPYFPIDLRWVGLPLFYAIVQAITPRLGWPGRATITLGLAVFSALVAHVHASAALAFAGVGWAQPGIRVDLLGFAATIGSLVTALAITLETGRDRFLARLVDRGMLDAQTDAARDRADGILSSTLTSATIAIAVLALALRIMDQFLGGNSLPLPDVIALGVVLALGAILLGVRGREDFPGSDG